MDRDDEEARAVLVEGGGRGTPTLKVLLPLGPHGLSLPR
jgi:hypothetical protein